MTLACYCRKHIPVLVMVLLVMVLHILSMFSISCQGSWNHSMVTYYIIIIYIYILNLRWAKGCSSNDSRPHSPAPEELSTFQTGEAKRVQKQSLNRGPSTWPCRCIACALGSLPQSYNILDLQSKSFVSLQLRILELAVSIREQTPGYWNRSSQSNLIN